MTDTEKGKKYFIGWLPFGNSMCLSMFIIGKCTKKAWESYHDTVENPEHVIYLEQPLRMIEMAVAQQDQQGVFSLQTQYQATEVPYFDLTAADTPLQYPFYLKDFMTHQLVGEDHRIAKYYEKALISIRTTKMGLHAADPGKIVEMGKK